MDYGINETIDFDRHVADKVSNIKASYVSKTDRSVKVLYPILLVDGELYRPIQNEKINLEEIGQF